MAKTAAELILKKYGIHLHVDNSRIRCMPHVVNIVVQKILSTLNEADDPDVIGYFKTDGDGPIHYDPATDPEQQKMHNDAEVEDKELAASEAAMRKRAADTTDGELDSAAIQKDVILGLIASLQSSKDKEKFNSPVKRLRIICTKIVSSPQRRAKFRRHLQNQYPDKVALHALMVIRDDLLNSHQAIDSWVFEHRDELGSNVNLSREDWDILTHVEDLLGIFPDVTRHMSQSGQPTLPWVLPMYHYMDEELQKRIGRQDLPENIRAAAEAGLTRLRHYYELAVKCQYNWIATALHPALRNWAEMHRRGEESENILKFAFKSYEQEYSATAASQPPQPSKPTNSFLDRVLGGQSGVLPPRIDAARGEIERYLGGFAAGFALWDNSLMWWKVRVICYRDPPALRFSETRARFSDPLAHGTGLLSDSGVQRFGGTIIFGSGTPHHS
ncbi:hypothetical protein EXIGLDRAFT_603806 [Exidia glandulosa HHB12029]|uniref:HAT C-terminal dimerisation domain-containing protein n=1 Tax=Exidia glandulosa HHB12029 TaxID=1314781 RepID=A0A165NHP8_EXIGL|nr:hypothetical protein EXIGLDRAFT_603806 [Exidia glandulosa HHB12029]